jgi:outer membrane receptor for ferrienterochelin and colicins
VPGVFVQDEFSPANWLVLAASARVDASDFGTFVSPRFSALFRTNDDWSVRASLGTGFAAPTPLVEEIEARGLSVLAPLRNLQAERAASASLDGSWRINRWDLNASVFASETRHPLMTRNANDGVHLELVNSEAARRVHGAELLVGYVAGSLHMLASSTYLDATEADRIPRFTAELAGILEDEDRGRVGLELSYTGRQALADNPYRTEGKAFLEINALAEIKIGESSIFLNAINLTNVRQSDFDPLLRPTPGPAGDPIVSVWAPLEGLTFNLGIRVDL